MRRALPLLLLSVALVGVVAFYAASTQQRPPPASGEGDAAVPGGVPAVAPSAPALAAAPRGSAAGRGRCTITGVVRRGREPSAARVELVRRALGPEPTPRSFGATASLRRHL